MMFASLVLERPELSWPDMAGGLENWFRNVGGFSAAALVIWLLLRLIRGKAALAGRPRWPRWQASLFQLLFAGAALGYLLLVALYSPLILEGIRSALGGQAVRRVAPLGAPWLQSLALYIGGGCSVAAIALPFIVDLFRYRARRIGAVARLSFKEALRRRVLWVFFGVMVVVLLFVSWFIEYKPEDQVRNYVRVLYWVMAPLMLVMGGLLASFSLPADIRDQTIHTIVTKPVERFELVIGRFLGYSLLMTLVLVVMTGVSLLYVMREIHPDAAVESMKARVPIYGRLEFRGIDKQTRKDEGVNVGREWDYRSYIAGTSSQVAVWVYQTFPAELANRQGKVPCEFSFDIFRTLKGEEGKGVFCTFTFVTHRWNPEKRNDYERELADELKKPGANADEVHNHLAEKYGVFEVKAKEIADYHTQDVEVPAGLFKNAAAEPQRKLGPSRGSEEMPALEVRIHCDSGGQYIGMAGPDFYILGAEESFAWNFFKGAGGLWLRVLLVIGLAVTCSTYLSGIISFLVTMFIYIAGIFQEYIQQLVQNKVVGGGPFEAAYRLIGKENLVNPVQQTPTAQMLLNADVGYRWVLAAFRALLPDVERFDWTNYVSEGFNIGLFALFVPTFLLLVGYLVPCALVAYYLMKSREIAS